VQLNESLAAFALHPQADFDVVNAYTSDFASRGVCATTDPQSRPAAGMFHGDRFRKPALRAER
jgi:hypothetical protein